MLCVMVFSGDHVAESRHVNYVWMLSSMESRTFGEVVWLANEGKVHSLRIVLNILTSSNTASMSGGEHKESGSGLHKK